MVTENGLMTGLLLFGCAAFGQFCLLVLFINAVHGSGIKFPFHEPLTVLALLAMAVGTSIVGWKVISQPEVAWHWSMQIYGGVCILVGLLGFPLATLALMRRPIPDGIQGSSQFLELGSTGINGAVRKEKWVGDGQYSWILRLPGNQSLLPTFEDHVIELPGLPEELASLRILHLTDLHLAPCFAREFFEAVVDAGQKLEPDLVLLTGDIAEHLDTIEWIVPLLSRLKGRLGQFAILGNHDLLYDEQRIREAVVQAGFEDIDGRWVTVKVEGKTLALGGTSAPWGPTLTNEGLPESHLCIVLSHTPDQFYRIAAWKSVDLVLAGHNHGGQVRLPMVGPVLMPSIYSRKFDRGFFRKGRTLMYVSRGLAAKHPLRWNCPPEISQLMLQPTGHAITHAQRATPENLVAESTVG